MNYDSINNAQEDQAVMRLKENPKSFYSFARSRQNTRAKVGRFLDPETGVPDCYCYCLIAWTHSIFACWQSSTVSPEAPGSEAWLLKTEINQRQTSSLLACTQNQHVRYEKGLSIDQAKARVHPLKRRIYPALPERLVQSFKNMVIESILVDMMDYPKR